MYEINQDTNSGEARNGLKPGINENVFLTKVAYDKAGNKEDAPMALIFTFANADGGSYEEKVFALDPERIKANSITYPRPHGRDDSKKGYVKGKQITPDQAVAIAFADLASKIKHIMNKFIPEDEIVLRGADFQQFSQNVINTLAGKTEGMALRLKIVYNNKDFYSLPKFPPFVECMSVTPSALTINPKYDRLEKTTKDDENQPPALLQSDNSTDMLDSLAHSTLADAFPNSTIAADDLPF
jgi:hypothetical protein